MLRRVSLKKDTDLVGCSDENIALISGLSILKCSAIGKFTMDSSFVGIPALRAEILSLKVLFPKVKFA